MSRAEALRTLASMVRQGAAEVGVDNAGRPKLAVQLSTTPIAANEPVLTIKGPVAFDLNEAGWGDYAGELWLAFIDEMPGANREHPCRYVFIGQGGLTYEVPAMAPPSQKNTFELQEISLEDLQ